MVRSKHGKPIVHRHPGRYLEYSRLMRLRKSETVTGAPKELPFFRTESEEVSGAGKPHCAMLDKYLARGCSTDEPIRSRVGRLYGTQSSKTRQYY
jgi:hypothetical protein